MNIVRPARAVSMRPVIAILALAPASGFCEWAYEEFADSFTGETSFVAFAESDEPVIGQPDNPEHATLQLRCDKDGGNPYWRMIWPTLLTSDINSNTFLGVTVDSRMQIRFDDGRIYGPGTLMGGWPLDEPVGTTQSMSNAAFKGILDRALEAETVMIRDYSWDGNALTAAFSTSGLAEAVALLSEHCRRLD